MPLTRIAVSPATVTVLGYNVKETDPAWAGLNFRRAEPRQQNSAMLMMVGPHEGKDIHLNVPFLHPADKKRGMREDGCRYRVRPKMKVGKKYKDKIVTGVAFEKWNGKWFIAVETK